MFSNGSSIPVTMNVAPTGTTGSGGLCGGNWGEGGWFWLIIILILFGGWGYGNGGFGGGAKTTESTSVFEGYTLNNDMSILNKAITDQTLLVDRKFEGVTNGLCDGFYTTSQQINNVTQSIADSNYAIQNAITTSRIAGMQDSFGLQSAINGVNVNNNTNTQAITAQLTGLGTQLQQCCCDAKYQSATQFADLNYRMAEQNCQTRQAIADSTAAVTANQDANTRAILDFLTQDKISALTAENASLKAAANNAAQTYEIVSQLRTPTPIPSYSVPNPYCNCNCNIGCGC